MTNEYKKELLNYVTGDLITYDGNDIPIFTKENDLISNINNFSDKILTETECDEISFNGYLSFSNTNYKIIWGNLIYYSYGNNPEIRKGLLIIVDNDINFVDYFTKYDSGTDFYKFEVLKVDEENNIYGIDNSGTSTNTYRFIMLNDVLYSYIMGSKNVVKLRKSYLFPTQYNSLTFNGSINDTGRNRIYKEYGSANYLFIGVNSSNFVSIITLEVNVGSENTWQQYTSSYAIYDDKGIASYCNWQNDNLDLKIGCSSSNQNYYYEFVFDGESISRTENISCSNISNIEIQNLNDTYIFTSEVINNDSYSQTTINFYKINYSNNEIFNIYKFQQNGYSPQIYSYVVSGITFTIIDLVKSNGEYSSINIILDEKVYSIDYNPSSTIIGNIIKVENNYNLYRFLIPQANSDIVNVFTLDYNVANYNGNQYIDYNSLIPNKVRLFKNNGLIFSRNLYNKTILNNSTISTVEIPYTMLNDDELTKKELVSKTSLVINQNNDSFSKNIYENVFINFINNINVIDEDTDISYQNIATLINSNINIGTQNNYSNNALNKVKINYADETSEIITIEWYNINELNKVTTFTIYAEKEIKSIDFISNDESKVYLTKKLETTIGKYYTITQKLRTGNKVTFEQLQYNNENIYYNSQEVFGFKEVDNNGS